LDIPSIAIAAVTLVSFEVGEVENLWIWIDEWRVEGDAAS
jgi:hypothetical protein